ncbi:MAG: hypothetical protein OEZ01_07550 [Candidatus Heimdallarchaeota archaeon]|nr:hypothetical protein [Candidatus Heimdallarchaeota archaeon]MDH5645846.1 hypothetical protein [Candidatus Heimdallarchaeota archaeon]
MSNNLNHNLKNWQIFFIIASIWNLFGSLPGMIDAPRTFQILFDRELTDPLLISIYRGAWGSTFLYFIGYLFVAKNPTKHTGIVIIGGIGKFYYAINLLNLYIDGLTSSKVLVVIVGDLIFTSLFVVFLCNQIKNKEQVI